MRTGTRAAGVSIPPVKMPPTMISISGFPSCTLMAAFSAALFQSVESSPRPQVAYNLPPGIFSSKIIGFGEYNQRYVVLLSKNSNFLKIPKFSDISGISVYGKLNRFFSTANLKLSLFLGTQN